METTDIDKTHIIVLKQVDGKFQNVKLPVNRPEQFIAELKAMVENPNRTVWDMHSLFISKFPETEVRIDYIYPQSYNSTYVNKSFHPGHFKYDALSNSWEEAAFQARQEYLASCKEKNINYTASEMAKVENEAVAKLKKQQKCRYIHNAMRWIDAVQYTEAVGEISKDSSVKMYSRENIGWNSYLHNISNDVKIQLNTNFGFGSAAYFLLAVQYKGVDILPYSYLVKYYKANMADIVRCTRGYHAGRESWLASFDFISEFVNSAEADPDGFVKSYIMHEVEEMMSGLEAIAANPRAVIDSIGTRSAERCVVYVRPMLYEEKVRMQAYPEDTPILFKVQKITGALKFLDNLKKISNLVETVKPHIARLLEINMMLYPEVKATIAKISDKVAKQNTIKYELESRIAMLSEKLKPYEDEIATLRAEATPEKPFIMIHYQTLHPEYAKLSTEKNSVVSRLRQVNNTISDYKNFLAVLNGSAAKIEEIKQQAAA